MSNFSGGFYIQLPNTWRRRIVNIFKWISHFKTLNKMQNQNRETQLGGFRHWRRDNIYYKIPLSWVKTCQHSKFYWLSSPPLKLKVQGKTSWMISLNILDYDGHYLTNILSECPETCLASVSSKIQSAIGHKKENSRNKGTQI